MKTTKPISTVSFNTREFLELKLNALLDAKKVSFWAFIQHKPEDDEAGEKDHAHVWIEPAKALQTEDVREFLKELDPFRPDKPLGVLPFQSSKFDHWYLYALHDRSYLLGKGQSRRFHYSHDDIVSSDPDYLRFLARSIDLLGVSPYASMKDAIDQGISWESFFARGTVPLPQLQAWKSAYMTLWAAAYGVDYQEITFRNGRTVHQIRDMKPFDQNGEIISAESSEPDKGHFKRLQGASEKEGDVQ